ncbi:MAG: hypothetical protein LAN70_17955 [Acidobacteriia bacterium]|nr:hypothetical protein [Terriglobia bacterium]
MKTLLLAIAVLGFASPAIWGQEAALGDVAKASRSHTGKAAKVITNDDIPSRPPEVQPAAAAKDDSKLVAKRASAAGTKPASSAEDGVPCPADQLPYLLDQQGSIQSGIEVLKATIAFESDPNRLVSTEALLRNETAKLATLQQQIEAARKSAASPPANCIKAPAKDVADTSGDKQPEARFALGARPAPAASLK